MNSTNYVGVASRILSYIKAHGITQQHIVTKTNLSSPAVSLILRGKQGMYLDDYLEICQALELEYDYFLKEKGC